VSDPSNPVFLDYVNNRDFEADPESPEAGDLGTEGMIFIPARRSPNRCPLVVAAHEISGTTTVFQVHIEPPCDGDD
jgi:2',3'-cyclic-nucleotide 2'-phosphodiesterase/3'-nucleotidase/5'-nucleotidase